MANPQNPGVFETWITDTQPFSWMQPRVGDTGDFETWITDIQPFPAYTAKAIAIITGSATLTGLGALSVAGLIIKLGSTTLSGSGSLSVSGLLIIISTAILSGAGSLSCSGNVAGGTPYFRIWYIPLEDRQLDVPDEMRSWFIPRDMREPDIVE